ncbi:MAG: hypothetical protein Q7S35_01930 [Candidatus Limnocylindrales bacterium]|nr:hypothetical protein [Candidatus Limnocylindrales bacterium]
MELPLVRGVELFEPTPLMIHQAPARVEVVIRPAEDRLDRAANGSAGVGGRADHLANTALDRQPGQSGLTIGDLGSGNVLGLLDAEP